MKGAFGGFRRAIEIECNHSAGSGNSVRSTGSSLWRPAWHNHRTDLAIDTRCGLLNLQFGSRRGESLVRSLHGRKEYLRGEIGRKNLDEQKSQGSIRGWTRPCKTCDVVGFDSRCSRIGALTKPIERSIRHLDPVGRQRQKSREPPPRKMSALRCLPLGASSSIRRQGQELKWGSVSWTCVLWGRWRYRGDILQRADFRRECPSPRGQRHPSAGSRGLRGARSTFRG